jgi:preprotein translocase subunit SecF
LPQWPVLASLLGDSTVLDINKIVLWFGGALACLSVLVGGFFYVKHLQTEVKVAQAYAVEAKSVNEQNQKTIEKILKDKAFDEKLLQDLSVNKQEIRKQADERKAQVAKQPDGSTPPAIVCAITGVCN